jgi:hypothetical protein
LKIVSHVRRNPVITERAQDRSRRWSDSDGKALVQKLTAKMVLFGMKIENVPNVEQFDTIIDHFWADKRNLI